MIRFWSKVKTQTQKNQHSLPETTMIANVEQNAAIAARIMEVFPGVDPRVLTSVPVSDLEEKWESSRFMLDDVDSIFLFRKMKFTHLTPAQERRLASNLLRFPAYDMVEVIPDMVEDIPEA
ncbi:hypothetical protein HA466_0112270 [Hirschfeldia incana]|nr:hypothetical protein HA466_0112270 [Hirschfeldia incana]